MKPPFRDKIEQGRGGDQMTAFKDLRCPQLADIHRERLDPNVLAQRRGPFDHFCQKPRILVDREPLLPDAELRDEIADVGSCARPEIEDASRLQTSKPIGDQSRE